MSIEHGDLKRLIHNEIHLDEFTSKMGPDSEVVVLTFKVKGKAPADDLCGFIEIGYDWVLDADISPGEMDDGSYIVFVELARDQKLSARVVELCQDISVNLMQDKIQNLRARYRDSTREFAVDEGSIQHMVPDSSAEYLRKYPKPEKSSAQQLDSLKTAAGIKVNTKAPNNKYTKSLRVAAGIL